MSQNNITAKRIEKAPIEEIRFIKGEETIVESYPSYLIDESKISGGHAEWLFFPKNEEEIASIIQKAKEEEILITVSAARTGIVGSAVPFGGAVLSLERMDQIIGLGFDEDTNKWFVRVQPNITLNEINDIVQLKKFENNQSIPPEKNWVEKTIQKIKEA